MATPLTPTPHRWRFGLVNAFLVVAAGAAIALAIVVAREPKPQAGPAWPWSVPAHTADPLGAIAEHVQGEYRSPAGGGPLFAIDRGGLTDGDQPLALAELKDAQRHVVSVYGGQTAYFKLTSRCQGAACASAPARVDTAALTRRQGLELALYTLRNLQSISNVLVILPPAKSGSSASQALVFRRGEVTVTAKLDGPLQLPGSPTSVTASDVSAIARTTAPFTFKLSSGKVSTPSGKAQAAVIVSPQ